MISEKDGWMEGALCLSIDEAISLANISRISGSSK